MNLINHIDQFQTKKKKKGKTGLKEKKNKSNWDKNFAPSCHIVRDLNEFSIAENIMASTYIHCNIHIS